MAGERILIIEDDSTLLRGLMDNFEFEGYRVQTASDGQAGLEKLLESVPDLVILDIMLPGINGYEICRLAREKKLQMPIIMLTAKGQESDIVLGLNLGADDYVTKPFSIKELLARVSAMLRRLRQEKPMVYSFGPFTLDTVSRRLTHDGGEIVLTPKEYDLLHFFCDRHGRALTRDEILNKVWGFNVFVTARSVDRCVNTLRQKIESNPTQPQFIKTVRQIGYRFELPENNEES